MLGSRVRPSVKYVKSGIPLLDLLLDDKGFPRGSTISLTGATGSGKSIFGTQFLVEGALKYNQVGLYILMEEDKSTYLRNMESFSWDINLLLVNKQIVLLDYPPTEVDQLIQPSNPIKELIESYGVERVVIDSIMPVAIQFNDAVERQRQLLRLIENVKKWDTTTIIIANDVSNGVPFESFPYSRYGIEYLTDGWINLYYYYKGKERKRALEVMKMKGIRHYMRPVEYVITETGISIKAPKELSKASKKKTSSDV